MLRIKSIYLVSCYLCGWNNGSRILEQDRHFDQTDGRVAESCMDVGPLALMVSTRSEQDYYTCSTHVELSRTFF